MTDWPKQDDPTIKETNIGILRQVIGLLYETHITEDKTAKARAEAIQAVNRMMNDLGFATGIKEQERIMLSERRRNSEIWNKPEEGQ